MSATAPEPHDANPTQPARGLRPADPRAGKLCTSCNQAKPARPAKHCPGNTACPWWVCGRCGSYNDARGNNTPGPTTPRQATA